MFIGAEGEHCRMCARKLASSCKWSAALLQGALHQPCFTYRQHGRFFA